MSVREWKNEMRPEDEVKILPKADIDAANVSDRGSTGKALVLFF